MSLPNDEFRDVFSNKNKMPEYTTEGITSGDIRSKVNFADKSIKDDINDYVFLKPTKKKKRSSKKTKSKKSSNLPKKKKSVKKILLIILIVLLCIILAITGTAIFLVNKGSKELLENENVISAPENVTVQNKGEFVVYNGVTYEYNKNMTSILCLGIDRDEFADSETEVIGQGGQSDMVILAAVDTSTGKTTLINISRDTMTDIAVYSDSGIYVETITAQLCLAYAYGDGRETSCENTKTAVQRLFYNIPINSYYALDLDGISTLNDCVGGIDVVSPETVWEFEEGESYHLVGDQAEQFVRKRVMDTPEANNRRMKRQQIYLDAFIDKVIEQTKEDIMTPVNLFNEATPYSCTNLNVSRVCYLAETIFANGGVTMEMVTVPGESKKGEVHAEYYIDEEKFYEMFLDIYYTPVK